MRRRALKGWQMALLMATSTLERQALPVWVSVGRRKCVEMLESHDATVHAAAPAPAAACAEAGMTTFVARGSCSKLTPPD